MAQGLQCWDAQGRVAVDLTDYNLRYMGSTTVTFGATETSKNVAFGGATQSGTVVIVTSASLRNPNEYFCRAYNGGFNAVLMQTSAPGVSNTLTIEVYNFE